MKFLVTGGLGLIGHNVVQRLQKRGDDVVIVDNRTTYGIIPQDELDYLMADRSLRVQQVRMSNAYGLMMNLMITD